MSTIAINLGIMRTETRIRSTLMNLRTTHKDVTAFDSVSRELLVGETVTFVAKKFFYGFLRDKTDIMTVTAGTPAVVINLTDVEGMLAFPYPCTVTLTVPALSVIALPRRLEAVYS